MSTRLALVLDVVFSVCVLSAFAATSIHVASYGDSACTRLKTSYTYLNDSCVVAPWDRTTVLTYDCVTANHDCFKIEQFTLGTNCTGTPVATALAQCGGCNPYYECQPTYVIAWSQCGNYQCSPCSESNMMQFGECGMDGIHKINGYTACGHQVLRTKYFNDDNGQCLVSSSYGARLVRSGECFYDQDTGGYSKFTC